MGVANHEQAGAHGLQIAQRVDEGFALARGGTVGVEVQYVRTEPLGRQLERRAGACGGFEEQIGDGKTAQRTMGAAAQCDGAECLGRIEQADERIAREVFQ